MHDFKLAQFYHESNYSIATRQYHIVEYTEQPQTVILPDIVRLVIIDIYNHESVNTQDTHLTILTHPSTDYKPLTSTFMDIKFCYTYQCLTLEFKDYGIAYQPYSRHTGKHFKTHAITYADYTKQLMHQALDHSITTTELQ